MRERRNSLPRSSRLVMAPLFDGPSVLMLSSHMSCPALSSKRQSLLETSTRSRHLPRRAHRRPRNSTTSRSGAPFTESAVAKKREPEDPGNVLAGKGPPWLKPVPATRSGADAVAGDAMSATPLRATIGVYKRTCFALFAILALFAAFPAWAAGVLRRTRRRRALPLRSPPSHRIF